MVIAIVIIAIVLIVVMFLISTYNTLVRLRNAVKDQWAQVDVLLKRRSDLIPNIVETVKGYAAHEKATLDAVITARSKAVSAKNPSEEMAAQGELTQALGRLMVLTESYPELKANANFMQLQDELRNTEDKIAYSRQFYNDSVLNYKNKLEMFPTNVVANMFGFKPEAFFEVSEKEKEVPKVQF